ncbi:hypothetical protein [Thiomonas sp.]|jgi:hypothetical protein|uniref:hypothetical protein n=1 Tax=Thiomonas sp. TaxID=2047785 RepID=UPI00262C705C|nr:hypothetical protein [Thiomonas sp.]
MRTLFEFSALMLLGALLVALGIILGDYASWYFAWIVGTAMIVLVSAAALAWLDAQEAARARSLPRDKS